MNDTLDGPLRVAAIDIGTNSVRMIAAEAQGADAYETLADERDQTRLGYRLDETGRLDPGSIAATLTALLKMRSTASYLGVAASRTVATAALREAANGSDLVTAARTVGIDIEVISPEEEAELALRSVTSNFELGDEPVAVVDIGGGSMEIVITTGGAIGEVHSLPLGAVRLTERFVKSDPITDGDWDALSDETDRELAAAFGGRPQLVSEMIGSGGTFTTLETMTEAGPSMTIDDIEKQALRLRALPLDERQRVQGLPPARADIILAGTAVVLQTARYLQAARISVNHTGIRDGMILEMISRLSS